MNQIFFENCKGCVFSVKEGREQINCALDRLEKLRENGANLIGIDDGEEVYISLDGRVCNAKRNEGWGRKHPRRKWRKVIDEETQMQCDIIIRCGSDQYLSDIGYTQNCAVHQSLQPKSIIVVLDRFSPVEVGDLIPQMKKCPVPWKVEQIVDDRDPIDYVIRHCKGNYFAVFNAGAEISTYFIDKLNQATTYDMLRFVAVRPDAEGNGMVMQTLAHKYAGGNKDEPALDKLEREVSEQGKTYLIKDFQELETCPP